MPQLEALDWCHLKRSLNVSNVDFYNVNNGDRSGPV
jgi:hypothetical protein